MKKIQLLTAVLGLAILFTACKKEKTDAPAPTPTPATKKVAKIETLDQSELFQFTYDAAGNLTTATTANVKFVYPASGFAVQVFNLAATPKKIWEIVNPQLTNGKLVNFERKDIANDGSVMFHHLFQHQYSTDGFITQSLNVSVNSPLDYVYQNGDLVKFTWRKNNTGTAKNQEDIIEYDMEHADKMNINFWNVYFNYALLPCAKEELGKKSGHLPKKITSFDIQRGQTIYDINYTFDNEGYVTAFTVNKNNSTAFMKTYKVTYQ